MTESIEENLRSGDYNTIFFENILPEVRVLPLLRLQTTMDESNRSNRFLDYVMLLSTDSERHGWCDEPGDLCGR